jgi:quinol monooxygenase YgiN
VTGASAGIGKIDPDRPAKRGDDLILVAHRKKRLRVFNLIRPYMANSEKRIPMDNQKIYLLAELTVLPEFLEEVKTALRKALIPTVREPGCEALFETSREDHPHKLIFFGVFLSPETYKFHLEQNHRSRCSRLLRASWPKRQL